MCVSYLRVIRVIRPPPVQVPPLCLLVAVHPLGAPVPRPPRDLVCAVHHKGHPVLLGQPVHVRQQHVPVPRAPHAQPLEQLVRRRRVRQRRRELRTRRARVLHGVAQGVALVGDALHPRHDMLGAPRGRRLPAAEVLPAGLVRPQHDEPLLLRLRRAPAREDGPEAVVDDRAAAGRGIVVARRSTAVLHELDRVRRLVVDVPVRQRRQPVALRVVEHRTVTATAALRPAAAQVERGEDGRRDGLGVLPVHDRERQAQAVCCGRRAAAAAAGHLPVAHGLRAAAAAAAATAASAATHRNHAAVVVALAAGGVRGVGCVGAGGGGGGADDGDPLHVAGVGMVGCGIAVGLAALLVLLVVGGAALEVGTVRGEDEQQQQAQQRQPLREENVEQHPDQRPRQLHRDQHQGQVEVDQRPVRRRVPQREVDDDVRDRVAEDGRVRQRHGIRHVPPEDEEEHGDQERSAADAGACGAHRCEEGDDGHAEVEGDILREEGGDQGRLVDHLLPRVVRCPVVPAVETLAEGREDVRTLHLARRPPRAAAGDGAKGASAQVGARLRAAVRLTAVAVGAPVGAARGSERGQQEDDEEERGDRTRTARRVLLFHPLCC